MIDSKNETIAFKVSKSQKHLIEARAKREGVPISEYVRNSVLDYPKWNEIHQFYQIIGIDDRELKKRVAGLLHGVCMSHPDYSFQTAFLAAALALAIMEDEEKEYYLDLAEMETNP